MPLGKWSSLKSGRATYLDNSLHKHSFVVHQCSRSCIFHDICQSFGVFETQRSHILPKARVMGRFINISSITRLIWQRTLRCMDKLSELCEAAFNILTAGSV